MFLLGETVVTSASDLTNASHCEFAFLRQLDAKLGRGDAVEETPDPMLERAGRLGTEHEERVLADYRASHDVVEIERVFPITREGLELAAAETKAAFEARADVVFQATFFDGEFVGYADFIVHLGDGVYEVQDTKLARSAKVTALLQLAAYGEQLHKLGIETGETVRLILGDRSESVHRLRDILPVYRNRRDRLRALVDERVAEGRRVEWGDPRYAVCGRCGECDAEIQEHRDLLLVAGLRLTQRARLYDAGITTIDQLAISTKPVPGIADAALTTLRRQASLQLAPHDAIPPVELYNAAALAAIPTPDEGDIFFDFEGDPLYTEGEAHDWGLDYLFGLVTTDESFVPFWAHTLRDERDALIAFLAYVAERRERHPNLHIYHYAAYERTHLLSLAARHGVGEREVDDLLRENVLVDLYPLVRHSLRLGSRSYSLKKLEPLYMGEEIRTADVTNAAASIDEYARSRQLHEQGEVVEAQRMLDEIGDYNRYDCVSTLRLRDWLLARAAERGVYPGTLTPAQKDLELLEPSPLHGQLLALAGDPLDPERGADATALALAAAAIDYHRRENKSFWWEHFARLTAPIEDWADTRDVFIVDRVEVERDWHREGQQRSQRRHLRLGGTLAPGSRFSATMFLLYEYPGPFTLARADPGSRPYRSVGVLEVGDDGTVLVAETLPKEVEEYNDLPSALTPGPPPDPGSQVSAIAEWGQAIVDASPSASDKNWPKDAVLDLLRRVPPRLKSAQAGSGSLPTAVDPVHAVTAALLDLDDSYLAVQGPPGTGKTYLAAHVITALVRDHGWKIGVVAQSHAVVENVLDRVVAAGLPAGSVGKATADPLAVYTVFPKNGVATFAASNPRGFVIGGTAWDFSNAARFPRRSLDLLVIDEAGQFSLGYTIAASVAARNLLLLGDPQQLPQVSQGTHPEPIDTSALGFISDGHDVLPPELGFFLAESRRMHAEVTRPVSHLSYADELRAHPTTGERSLAGIEPGLHIEPVVHSDNATSSTEEAERVVALVRDVLGRDWTDPSAGRSRERLGTADVIVVTPYNAQVGVVVDALASAGLEGVRVGTVDKFQGQEAVVAIVTLAASSPADVPRGMPFLIMKNRLNVAISRAQWAAYLIYSPALVDYLPHSAAEVAQLSAFIELTGEPGTSHVAP